MAGWMVGAQGGVYAVRRGVMGDLERREGRRRRRRNVRGMVGGRESVVGDR